MKVKGKVKPYLLLWTFMSFCFIASNSLIFLVIFISGFPVSIDIKVVVVFIGSFLSQIVITLSKMYNSLVNIELIPHIFDAQRVVTV